MFEKVLPSRSLDAGSGQTVVPSRGAPKPGDYPALQSKGDSFDLASPSTPASAEAAARGQAANAGVHASESPSRLIVGPDVKLKGADIADCDTLVVEGRVEATMVSRLLHIAEHGAFSGKVSIDVAEIRGKFEGELTVGSMLVIHATGEVLGTIRYGSLLIEAGGRICGDVQAIATNSPKFSDPVFNVGKEADSTKVSLLSSVA